MHFSLCSVVIHCKGAKVNNHDQDGQTALMMASSKGFADIVRLLLDAGQDTLQYVRNISATFVIVAVMWPFSALL